MIDSTTFKSKEFTSSKHSCQKCPRLLYQNHLDALSFGPFDCRINGLNHKCKDYAMLCYAMDLCNG